MLFTFKVYYEDDAVTFRRKNCFKLIRARTPDKAIEKFKMKFQDFYPLYAV